MLEKEEARLIGIVVTSLPKFILLHPLNCSTGCGKGESQSGKVIVFASLPHTLIVCFSFDCFIVSKLLTRDDACMF